MAIGTMIWRKITMFKVQHMMISTWPQQLVYCSISYTIIVAGPKSWQVYIKIIRVIKYFFNLNYSPERHKRMMNNSFNTMTTMLMMNVYLVRVLRLFQLHPWLDSLNVLCILHSFEWVWAWIYSSVILRNSELLFSLIHSSVILDWVFMAHPIIFLFELTMSATRFYTDIRC